MSQDFGMDPSSGEEMSYGDAISEVVNGVFAAGDFLHEKEGLNRPEDANNEALIGAAFEVFVRYYQDRVDAEFLPTDPDVILYDISRSVEREVEQR